MKTRIARLWPAPLFAGSSVPRSSLSSPLLSRTFFAAAPRSSFLSPCQRSALARRGRFLRFKSDSPRPQQPNPTPHLGSPEPAPSLSQRLKKLSREYGWTAVGVYFALSVLDFPFCFLAVRLLGTDRIGHYEDVVKNAFWTVVRLAIPDAGRPSAGAPATEDVAEATAREGHLSAAEVAERSRADASIWTQLGLAYLVHKSFIFIRVPLTAAVLPKVVKTLRKWGYDIGKKKPKTA
ncbi:hypothetical protein BKA63DRAFT_3098 [Paraphoma chrysanthemicola]|nr:hypothetical protein BKA63DRAFT_3098 [Paraphoma chrysanthemicola]